MTIFEFKSNISLFFFPFIKYITDWQRVESEFDIWQVVIHTQADNFVNMKHVLTANETQVFNITGQHEWKLKAVMLCQRLGWPFSKLLKIVADTIF